MSDDAPAPDDAERLRSEADAAIERYKAYLDSPTFQHGMDVAVLTKIAGDDSADLRERRRAAEILAKLRLQAMEGLAELVAAREQTMDRLGIKTGGPSVQLNQVSNRIEIVRACDWRNAAPLEDGGHIVDALPEAKNGHALPAPKEVDGDAADPPS